MGRNEKIVPRDYESLIGEGDPVIRIFRSMLESVAWRKAPPRAKTLYITMKAMFYDSLENDKDGFDEVYRKDNHYFTFNEAKWIKGNKDGFELYSDKKAFYKDLKILIRLGFIDFVDSGCGKSMKNLYMFSSRWTKYGTDNFEKAVLPTADYHLYVLKCENDCWYIGVTKDLQKRFNQHKDGVGSKWTKEHEPLSVEEDFDLICDSHTIHDAERMLTLAYIHTYGADKVRGAGYTTRSKIKNPPEQYDMNLLNSLGINTKANK